MKKLEEKYNRKRYRTAYTTTVFSITLVIFMLGLLALAVHQTNKLSEYLRGNIGIQLELSDRLEAEEALVLKDSLANLEFVSRSVYVSKEEAAKQLSHELGEDFVSFMGYIPLPASIELFLESEYTYQDSIAAIEQRLSGIPAIRKISYQKSLIDLINENLERIGLGILLFTGLLLIISVLLIYNTIRLAVFSRRMLIKSMLLVGATQGFIRKPFLIGGIWQGIISGAVAVLLLLGVMLLIRNNFGGPDMFADAIILWGIFLGMVVFSVIITFLSNYFAVKKYLKINSEDLY
ncbi:MAG: cell division protein FtsX [Bacteroidales bacterium]